MIPCRLAALSHYIVGRLIRTKLRRCLDRESLRLHVYMSACLYVYNLYSVWLSRLSLSERGLQVLVQSIRIRILTEYRVRNTRPWHFSIRTTIPPLNIPNLVWFFETWVLIGQSPDNLMSYPIVTPTPKIVPEIFRGGMEGP